MPFGQKPGRPLGLHPPGRGERAGLPGLALHPSGEIPHALAMPDEMQDRVRLSHVIS
jgi:hypothetical protein